MKYQDGNTIYWWNGFLKLWQLEVTNANGSHTTLYVGNKRQLLMFYPHLKFTPYVRQEERES